MLLTDKAKKDFLVWLYSEYDFTEKTFNELYPENLKEWFIIQWFDSVGIIIEIRHLEIPKTFYSFVHGRGIDFSEEHTSNRTEATKQVIKYANRHYNFNNNKD